MQQKSLNVLDNPNKRVPNEDDDEDDEDENFDKNQRTQRSEDLDWFAKLMRQKIEYSLNLLINRF